MFLLSQSQGEGETLNVYLVEEKGNRQLIWTLDDSYVKEQENEKWFEGQVKMEAGNQNKNYRVILSLKPNILMSNCNKSGQIELNSRQILMNSRQILKNSRQILKNLHQILLKNVNSNNSLQILIN